mgnify:CR=1 FL=1
MIFLTEHFLAHLDHNNEHFIQHPIQQYINRVLEKVLGVSCF